MQNTALPSREVSPEQNDVLFAIDCEDSREDGTSKWELSNIQDVESEEDTEEDTEEDSDEGCGACIEIWEGGSDKPRRKLEKVQPITTRKDVEDFYCYECKDNYSFNGDNVVPLIPDRSLVFVHEHESSCDLSLVIVHDSKKDYSPGRVVMKINGDLEDSVVQDGRDSPSDDYDYDKGDDETTCSWEWSWQSGRRYRTDGIADYWRPDKRECRYIDVEKMEGIKRWQFVPGPVPSSGKVDTDDYITLDKDERLWICEC
jgi:hypothetical protein